MVTIQRGRWRATTCGRCAAGLKRWPGGSMRASPAELAAQLALLVKATFVTAELLAPDEATRVAAGPRAGASGCSGLKSAAKAPDLARGGAPGG